MAQTINCAQAFWHYYRYVRKHQSRAVFVGHIFIPVIIAVCCSDCVFLCVDVPNTMSFVLVPVLLTHICEYHGKCERLQQSDR